MNKHHLVSSATKALKTFVGVLPIIMGMLLLTSLAINLFPLETVSGWFGEGHLLNVLIGTIIGSIAAAHPLASYLLGGELLSGGVSLFAVTALIVSWVTVGIVQLPAEMLLLGKRFALYRNITCFFLAILISFMTVYTLVLFN